MRTINNLIYRASAYTMMTDRSILQSASGSSVRELSFADAASLAGVLRDIAIIIPHISVSIVNDDKTLTHVIDSLLDLSYEAGRINGNVYAWLDTALFLYEDMIYHDDPTDYVVGAREWEKIIYIVRRRILA